MKAGRISSYIRKAIRVLKLVWTNPHFIKKGLNEIKKNGFAKLKEKMIGAMYSNQTYTLSLNNKETDYTDIEKEISSFQKKPLVSIVMPVYNVEIKWLSLAIQSVFAQTYYNWELCIVDDASTKQEIRDYLLEITEDRVKIKLLSSNQGISGASNEAVSIAKGEYIVLLDNDDELHINALYEIVKAINQTEAEFIYSDEDKIDKNGNHRFPFFKPDWSPDLLRSQMYIGHIFAFKRKLFEKVGGFRLGYEGSQDFDLALRMSEETNQIHHIPKVLYSWREIETSTASNPDSKPYAHEAGLKALNEHLGRVFGKGKAWAEEDEFHFVYDARYKVEDEAPIVSVIIPTKDKLELLAPCIESILSVTEGIDYEILILDNNSESIETKDWFAKIQDKYDNIRVISAHYEFNWSKLNNHGIRESRGNVFIFLNNDTVILSSDWMQRMSEKALREDVGTVGGLLLFEDNTIQHAGVVMGMGGWADHIFKGMKPVHFGSPFVSPMLTRNVAASTGACLAVSRKTINKIGDFNEDFIICGSDVEISLRAIKQGLNNIYDPHVKLYHLESKTRSSFIPEIDFIMSKKHYSPYREEGDPFFNANLSLSSVVPIQK